MQSLQKVIEEHPFFKTLDEKYIEVLTGCAANETFKEGEFIFREGENADKFYLIREGQVALEIASPSQRPISIQTISNGDVLGFSWLFPPYRWCFDALTKSKVRAISMDGKCLRKKCEDDHALGYELQKRFGEIMAQRLQATRIQLMDLYKTPARG
ncbi:MAG: cyclic nucleotide-binding domain-containing protein [Candidatus Melainabacteria bacterium]|nr:cyclic nucleotide-binding domain-containing protein [Candidatus Melainabacteria bacterium]